MNRTKQILTYLLIAIIAVLCIGVVWHYFKTQIILGLGWLALFVLVFGAGWITGRLQCRKASAERKKIEEKSDEQ